MLVNDLPVINRLTEQFVEELLGKFCDVPGDRNCGGFVDPVTGYADSRNSIYDAQHLFLVYLYPDFQKYHRSPEMLQRLRLHVDFMHRRQYPDGSVGLGPAGVGSGNEVGFTLPGICETYRRLLVSDVPGRDELLASLGTYLLKGAECVRTLFPHTSNHRWTACTGPLAMVNSIFPDPKNIAVIEEYLSDGIDIDADGMFFEERSPNYNGVAQWGLLYLVDNWSRPDFLELIARNLNHSLRMRQPIDEAETLFSHRQDRGKARANWGDYLIFKRLAIETSNSEFAWAADHLRDKMIEADHLTSTLVPIRYAFDDPRLVHDNVPRSKPSDSVRYAFQDSPIYRFREGHVSSTVAADRGGHFFDITQGTWGGLMRSDLFFSYHAGDAIVDAVKIRWGSGTGGFRPETIDYKSDGSMHLCYVDPGWDHVAHYRPREKWGPRHVDTDQSAQVEISYDDIGVFTLRVRIGGLPEMPVNVQLLLREDNVLVLPDGLRTELGHGGRTFTSGTGPYTLAGCDGSRISIEGLPESEHRFALGDARTIAGVAENRCHRLIAGLFTPVDMTLTFRPN